MPPANHIASWPDKAMFAALLLILGGGLGVGFEALRAVATVHDNLPAGLLDQYPSWLSLVMAFITLACGIVTLRTHAAVWGYTGAVAGMFSLAYAGLVPFLSLVAIGMLIKSKLEGEETRNDGVTLSASEWPDKAMAASLFLFVGGPVLLLQSVSIAFRNEPTILATFLPITSWGEAALDAVAAVFLVWAAREVYNVRKAWPGYAGAALALVTGGLYLLGPTIGIVAFLFMRAAAKENEFVKHAPGVPQVAPDSAPASPPVALKPKKVVLTAKAK